MTLRLAHHTYQDGIDYLERAREFAKTLPPPLTLDDCLMATQTTGWDFAMYANDYIDADFPDYPTSRRSIIAELDEAIKRISAELEKIIPLEKYTDRRGDTCWITVTDRTGDPVDLCETCADSRGYDPSLDPDKGTASLERHIYEHLDYCLDQSLEDSSPPKYTDEFLWPGPEECDKCRKHLWSYDADHYRREYIDYVKAEKGIAITMEDF